VSLIQQALLKLDEAVAKAEGAHTHVQSKLAITQASVSAAQQNGQAKNGAQGAQPDMFGAPETYIDGALVAQKLDSTINKMEKLLESA
jgi:hypothetical protein